MNESDWDRLIDGLKTGDCIPFLGAGVCSGTLPTGGELSLQWAEKVDYPLENRSSLIDVMDYAVTMHGNDAVYVKQRVIRDLLLDEHEKPKLPDFSSPYEPHRVLARFPLPIYFTTNYDDFLVRALTEADRKPVTLTCRWHTNGPGPAAPRTRPTAKRPTVFHFHGSAAEPASLVLSRSDYVKFLITLTKDHASSDHALIPRPLLAALAERPLLFIGYSLQDWTFAVLFQSLLETSSSLQHRRHISIQLAPSSVLPGKERIAEEYQNKFFERWNITVYWGKVEDFCRELGARMGWSA